MQIRDLIANLQTLPAQDEIAICIDGMDEDEDVIIIDCEISIKKNPSDHRTQWAMEADTDGKFLVESDYIQSLKDVRDVLPEHLKTMPQALEEVRKLLHNHSVPSVQAAQALVNSMLEKMLK